MAGGELLLLPLSEEHVGHALSDPVCELPGRRYRVAHGRAVIKRAKKKKRRLSTSDLGDGSWVARPRHLSVLAFSEFGGPLSVSLSLPAHRISSQSVSLSPSPCLCVTWRVVVRRKYALFSAGASKSRWSASSCPLWMRPSPQERRRVAVCMYVCNECDQSRPMREAGTDSRLGQRSLGRVNQGRVVNRKPGNRTYGLDSKKENKGKKKKQRPRIYIW